MTAVEKYFALAANANWPELAINPRLPLIMEPTVPQSLRFCFSPPLLSHPHQRLIVLPRSHRRSIIDLRSGDYSPAIRRL